MRRKEKEVTDRQKLTRIILDSPYMTVALPDAVPYPLPLNFGYDPEHGPFGTAYAHAATAGRKLDLLRAAGGKLNVGLLFVCRADLVDTGKGACGLTTSYGSVMADAVMEEINGQEARQEAMHSILGKVDFPDRALRPEIMAKVAMLRFTMTTLSGKEE